MKKEVEKEFVDWWYGTFERGQSQLVRKIK